MGPGPMKWCMGDGLNFSGSGAGAVFACHLLRALAAHVAESYEHTALLPSSLLQVIYLIRKLTYIISVSNF